MIFVNQNIREYGVIELSQEIKKSLEENFGYIRLRGEVSGLSVSKAGHVFLSLKEQNDFVQAGEVIAYSGNQGSLSSGPHLHFELWKNGTPIDPEPLLNFQ